MKLTKSTATFLGCCGLITLLSGCASVMCGPRQKVAFDSKPSGADVEVIDSRGEVVFHKTTPCNAVLARREQDYLQSAKYTVIVKKEGYEAVQFPLTGVLNRAYLANVFSAGVGFIVDPLTGAMWTLTPSSFDTPMVTENAGFFNQEGLLVSLQEEPLQGMKPVIKAAKN